MTAMNLIEPKSPFRPPPWLWHPLVQSMLNSVHFRVPNPNPMAQAAREMILELEGGVRLQGFFSPQPGEAKGLAIMLHGWEGSADSSYILCGGHALYQAGFAVFRLNLRDHGQSHHLNEGIFRAFLLEEVHQAVGQAAQLAQGGPVMLSGLSLGGNFALRIAIRHSTEPIPGLSQVLAMCPVLVPETTADCLDASLPLKNYSIKKWRRSLGIKQELFPKLYDFTSVLAKQNLRDMTDAIIAMFGEFATSHDYYQTYTIGPRDLLGMQAPLTIITAQDDPVIPFEHFKALELPPGGQLIAPKRGGHGGFLTGPPLRSWCDERMVELFLEAAG